MSQVNFKPLLHSDELRDKVRGIAEDAKENGNEEYKTMQYRKDLVPAGSSIDQELLRHNVDVVVGGQFWKRIRGKTPDEIIEIIDGIEADLTHRAAAANNGNGGGANANA